MTPRILYKYVTPERIDVLCNKKIRYTQPSLLNDPFEFSLGWPEPTADGLGNFEEKKAKERIASYLEKSRLYGVLSLTEKNDSIPMWTHYASAHTGFVIGFSMESNRFAAARRNNKLKKVQYLSDRVNATRGLPGAAHVGPESILFAKSVDWEYEQEWRWVEPKPDDYAQVVEGQSGKSFFLAPVEPDSIVEVVLGCRSGTDLEHSIQALKSTADYRHLNLLKIRLDKTKYKLEVDPL